jgi:hypothetical protein
MNKKILSLSVMALLVLSVLPLVIADGADVDGDVTVGVEQENIPLICKDNTQRSWYPNDQTIKTADEYGNFDTNDYNGEVDESGNNHNGEFYDLAARGDYVFAGEVLKYYVFAGDDDGFSNIEDVTLQVDGVGSGNCVELVNVPADPTGADLDEFDCNPAELSELEDGDGAVYACTLVIQSGWTGEKEITVEVIDEEGHTDTTTSDMLTMNPDLSVTLSGAVSFGTVEPGDSVTSNTVFLNNVGSDGVVMDMYIGSDDYFTSSNPTALCANENGVTTNGIHHEQFSYYATKGATDSGDNDNGSPGLGDTICEADTDEYTELPSYSGDIEDDCRIINHLEQGSFLTQGQSMSLTFQLDVPDLCEGTFTNGKFHFTGRVV